MIHPPSPFTRDDWATLFRRFGIENEGLTSSSPLRYQGESLHIYWCHKDGLIYFAAREHEAIYPSQLWAKVDQSAVRDEDEKRHNVIPLEGLEYAAFRHRIGSVFLVNPDLTFRFSRS